MISSKNVAIAVGGKTARACDSCIKKRARWYCAPDDAFLCQSCDSSVHSANSLARRHERVRLKTASLKSLKLFSNETATSSFPSWHQGFTRKARTPRHGKAAGNLNSEKLRNDIIPFVPEVGSDETSHEENEEEQLLYRVPIFNPLVAELCTSTTLSNEAETQDQTVGEHNGIESKPPSFGLHGKGFMPSDMDLEEFAADVESLLGRGLENECFGMEELGLVDCKEEKLSLGNVKIEEEKEEKEFNIDTEIDMAREPPFEFNFDYDSATCGDEEDKFNKNGKLLGGTDDNDEKLEKSKKRKMLLRLDYEAVISAWASQGSPWTTGDRPDIDPDCWPDCMGISGTEVVHNPYGDQIGIQPAMVDGGREARVSRYREKRRTRLFSKKIRYEVRKLNAEKRPRMKGRFVKRANFSAPAANFPLHVK